MFVFLAFNYTYVGDENKIVLGAGANLQDGTVVHADPTERGGVPTTIGEYALVGHKAMLHGATIQVLCWCHNACILSWCRNTGTVTWHRTAIHVLCHGATIQILCFGAAFVPECMYSIMVPQYGHP